MSAPKGCAFSEMYSLVTPAPYLVSVSVPKTRMVEHDSEGTPFLLPE
jgi:hypothetical protein